MYMYLIGRFCEITIPGSKTNSSFLQEFPSLSLFHKDMNTFKGYSRDFVGMGKQTPTKGLLEFHR